MSAAALSYFGTIDDQVPWVEQFHERERLNHPPPTIIGSGAGFIAIAWVPPGVSRAQAKLNEITGEDADWEASGSHPPNQLSKDLALRVLEASLLMGHMRPTYVTASAEGGVGIVYRSNIRYAAVECLNSGEMWLLWYDENGTPRSRQIEDNSKEINNALAEVTALHADA